MNAYCDRQSVDFNAIAFLFDGRRLRGEQTPDEVSLSLSFDLVFFLLSFFIENAFTSAKDK
jgi:Ubiquitin-2 like Rad60 SUMO-like